MVSPSPSLHKSQPSNLRVCSQCDGPMRGHTRVDRKYVCPPREKLNETLQLLWEEGHRDFVLQIANKLRISFSPLRTPPSTPAPSLAERIRQRKPTPADLPDRLDEEERKPKIEGSISSVTSGLRRMISTVIENRANPPQSPSLSSEDSSIPDTPSETLPAVGPWNAQHLQDWSSPAAPDDMPLSERGSLVPTLLIGSDGQTIREGSRAEAHFRAQAALEARLRRQQEQLDALRIPRAPASDNSQGLSVIPYDDNNDRDYEGSGFHRVLRSVMASPAIVAIPVRHEDVPRVQETAARQGLHTSVLEVIPKTPKGTSRALPQMLRNALVKRSASMSSISSAEDDRPIVVIGRDLAMTRRYVEMAQRGVMPGTVSVDQDLLHAPRMITMAQLITVSFFTVILAWGIFYFFLL
ncbi:hypothetical protein AN958_10487 [Leucoagaricus sp. SymC.cos]|nr:hypothetical protein AN958_10487 [Leucoagaricus sp. SymC.cos]